MAKKTTNVHLPGDKPKKRVTKRPGDEAELQRHQELFRSVSRALNESAIAELLDKAISAEASADDVQRLKDAVGMLVHNAKVSDAEYVALNDRYMRLLKEENERDRQTWAAAEQDAKDRARHYASAAVKEMDARAYTIFSALADRPDDGLAEHARILLDRWHQADEPGSVREQLEDMKNAHNRLTSEKGVYYNILQRHGLLGEVSAHYEARRAEGVA